jgi:hypothetical protein
MLPPARDALQGAGFAIQGSIRFAVSYGRDLAGGGPALYLRLLR